MDDWWEQASPEMAANRFLDELGETNAAVTQGIAPPGDEETTFEKVSDIILGLAFLGTTIVAAKR
eukprot:13723144-Ditylum_brightwellii.AAC.2